MEGVAPVSRADAHTANIPDMRPSIIALAGSILLGFPVAPLAAQASTTGSLPPILQPPPRNGLRCRADVQPRAATEPNIIVYQFEVPGEVTPSRLVFLFVDSLGQAIGLSDTQHHSAVGDTVIGTTVVGVWSRGKREGSIIVARTSQSAIRAEVQASIDAGAFTPASSAATRTDPVRTLTDAEFAEVQRLANWFVANRCPPSPSRSR